MKRKGGISYQFYQYLECETVKLSKGSCSHRLGAPAGVTGGGTCRRRKTHIPSPLQTIALQLYWNNLKCATKGSLQVFMFDPGLFKVG